MSEFQEEVNFVQKLRPYADCSDLVWASVISEVGTVGLRGVSKSATNLLMIIQDKAAREYVAKHPGHGSQAGHGNGGKNGKGGSGDLRGFASAADRDAYDARASSSSWYKPSTPASDSGSGDSFKDASDGLKSDLSGISASEKKTFSSDDKARLKGAESNMSQAKTLMSSEGTPAQQKKNKKQSISLLEGAAFDLSNADNISLQTAGSNLRDAVSAMGD